MKINNHKKIAALCIAFFMIFSMFNSFTYADSMTDAAKLNKLGLMTNVDEKSLDMKLSRMIGITMILKSLGYTEENARNQSTACLFTDVPNWFKGWAALAAKSGITAGVSKTSFDPYGVLTKKMFLAFQLRALGYDATDAWDKTEKLAKESGIITGGASADAQSFTKRDAAGVMLSALNAEVTGKGIKLIDMLIINEVVDENTAASLGFKNSFSGLKEGQTLPLINASCVQMSSNGKVVAWLDATVPEYNESNKTMYSINVKTGERFIEGQEQRLIHGLNLENGEEYIFGHQGKFNTPLAISADGNIVLYAEGDQWKASRIYGINLETGEESIAFDNAAGNAFILTPDGKTLLWSRLNESNDKYYSNRDLYGKNLITGETFTICEAYYDQNIEDTTPDGKFITWIDERDDYISIYVKNLETGAETVVDGDDYSNHTNRFDSQITANGKMVVYATSDYRRSDVFIFPDRIMATDLETGEEFAICDEHGYKQNPKISDDGKTVVWQDNRNTTFNDLNLDIYGKNLETGKEFIVCDMDGDQHDLKMSSDGKIVFWHDGDINYRQEIYGKNLETGKMFTIPDKGNKQILYDISSDGSVILWADNDDWYVQNIEPFIN